MDPPEMEVTGRIEQKGRRRKKIKDMKGPVY